MAAHENLGRQFKVFHGTQSEWVGDAPPSASYEHPLHVSTSTDTPSDHAFGYGLGGSPREDWELLNTARIKEYDVHPDAKVHYTETEHQDAVLPEEEQRKVREGGYDMTVFPGSRERLGIVYNPSAIHHARDIGWKEHHGHSPSDEMEWRHGEHWREEV